MAKRTEIIVKCISDNEIYESIYTDFYRQLRIAIDSHPTLDDSNQLTNLCKEILKDITLDFGLWMIGMRVTEEIVNELF